MKHNFIIIEGGDCCGKSTTATMVLDYLEERNIKYFTFHPLYDHPAGRKAYEAMCRRDPIEEVRELVYEAHMTAMETLAIPAINRGEIVVQDRSLVSAIVYQWLNHGYPIDDYLVCLLKQTYRDLTPFFIHLDGDDSVIDARITAKENKDANESEALEFHQNIRKHYRDMMAVWKELGFDGKTLLTNELEPFSEELHFLLRDVV